MSYWPEILMAFTCYIFTAILIGISIGCFVTGVWWSAFKVLEVCFPRTLAYLLDVTISKHRFCQCVVQSCFILVVSTPTSSLLYILFMYLRIYFFNTPVIPAWDGFDVRLPILLVFGSDGQLLAAERLWRWRNEA